MAWACKGGHRIHPSFCNLEPGNYGIYLNGELKESRNVLTLEEHVIELQLEIDGSEFDVVLLKS